MALNPVTLTRNSPLLFRFMTVSRTPTLHFGSKFKHVQVSSYKSSSSSCYQPKPVNSSSSPWNTASKDLGRVELGFKQLGFGSFRISAVSDRGSGGIGGSDDGNFGGSGGGGGDGGKSNWSFLSWYLSLLEKYPVLTKAVTSAILTFVGDLICQLAIDKVPSLDLKRIFNFTFLGLVLVGPTLHFWYLYLSKVVTMAGVSGVFVRLLVDQFIFAPIFVGVFLSSLITLNGRPSQVIQKLQQEWKSTVVANWTLWIPFQFLNFRFVPQQFQVLAANFIALIWNVILSYKANKEVVVK